MERSHTLVVVLLLVLASASSVVAGPMRTPGVNSLPGLLVQSTDWFAYRDWEELLLAQPDWIPYSAVRPYYAYHRGSFGPCEGSCGLVRMLLLRVERHSVRKYQLLRRIFDPRTINSLPKNEFPAFDYRLVPYSQELVADDKRPLHRIGTNAEAWFYSQKDWQVYVRARLENHGEYYPQFGGRVWKDKITGWLDNAAVYYSQKGLFFSAGRSFIVWGPESQDALLISDNSSAFDRIWFGYENRLLRFDAIHTRLDDMHVDGETLTRYLSAHRLTFRKAGSFELGLSEVVLYGGPGRQLEWYYLNPFLPYYWEQFNQRTDDNIMFGADLVVYWPKRARLFGELLIDDFQIDFKSEPDQVGYKLGIDALEPFGMRRLFTKLTYTRINPTVYGQTKPQNLYLHKGAPIGYFGGNDQDRWLALARYHLSVNFDGQVELQRQRRGEGTISVFPTAAVPFQNKFPTGVVERSTMLTLRCDFFTKLLLQGNLSVSYEYLENFAHEEGQSHNRLGFDLSLAWYLAGSTN